MFSFFFFFDDKKKKTHTGIINAKHKQKIEMYMFLTILFLKTVTTPLKKKGKNCRHHKETHNAKNQKDLSWSQD